MMSQMRFISDSDYHDLKFWGDAGYSLIKEIDSTASELYPDREYWCDTGNNLTVAIIQLETMKKEIEELRKPRWKKIFNKIKWGK